MIDIYVGVSGLRLFIDPQRQLCYLLSHTCPKNVQRRHGKKSNSNLLGGGGTVKVGTHCGVKLHDARSVPTTLRLTSLKAQNSVHTDFFCFVSAVCCTSVCAQFKMCTLQMSSFKVTRCVKILQFSS